MSDPDDARHDLERKALRNVRALVEKAHDEERSVNTVDANYLWHVALVLAGLLVLGLAVTFGVRWYRADEIRASEARREAELQAARQATPIPRSFGKRNVHVDAGADPAFRAYAAQCLATIAQRANTAYRPEVKGIDGRARVTFIVRSDGVFHGVEVHEASGHAAAGPAASRVIRLSEPCAVFPAAIQESADYLHVTTSIRLAGSSAGDAVSFAAEPPGDPAKPR